MAGMGTSEGVEREIVSALDCQERNGTGGELIAALLQLESREAGAMRKGLPAIETSAGNVSSLAYAKASLLQFLAMRLLQYTIEDDYVDLDLLRRRLAAVLKPLVENDGWIHPDLEAYFNEFHQIAALRLPAWNVLYQGSSFDAVFRVAPPGKPLIPVSSRTYAAVPVLEDTLANPRYVSRVVRAFAQRLTLLKEEERISCLCFIEKAVGPVGALGMLAALVHEVQMPACIYRAAYCSRDAKLVGHLPSPTDRVALVYDLLVTGNGIREAAEDLKAAHDVDVAAAVVLLAYENGREIRTAGGRSIRIEALEFYDAVIAKVEAARALKQQGETELAPLGLRSSTKAGVDFLGPNGIHSRALEPEVPDTGPDDSLGGPDQVQIPGKKNLAASTCQPAVPLDPAEQIRLAADAGLCLELAPHARAAVELVLERNQELAAWVEQNVLPDEPDRLRPVRPCGRCKQGQLHFVGTLLLEGKITLGSVVICDGCGDHSTRRG